MSRDELEAAALRLDLTTLECHDLRLSDEPVDSSPTQPIT